MSEPSQPQMETELFRATSAVLILAGICAGRSDVPTEGQVAVDARLAVRYADALLAELAR